jgi:predicted DNA-binding transcriptional regulator YafY
MMNMQIMNMTPEATPKPKSPFKRALHKRILWLHEKLAAGEKINCIRAAKELQLSRRTLLRDLEFMRTTCKLPIQYDPHRHTLYYAGEANIAEVMQNLGIKEIPNITSQVPISNQSMQPMTHSVGVPVGVNS